MFCFTFGGGQINFKSITLIFYLFKCPNLFEKKMCLKVKLILAPKLQVNLDFRVFLHNYTKFFCTIHFFFLVLSSSSYGKGASVIQNLVARSVKFGKKFFPLGSIEYKSLDVQHNSNQNQF
jgi:hypothetical protein